MKVISLKTRILIPLSLALCLLLGVFIFSTYRAHYKEISNNVEERLESVQEFLKTHLILEKNLLTPTMEMLGVNPQIQNAWLARDRASLLELTSPLMKNLLNKYDITHFYFHDINRVNFLRVHKPKIHGDLINRFTLLEAEKSGQSFAGIEIGPLGTLALRVVHPWRINGEIVGYIELGEDIKHIANELHEIVGVEVYISVYKKFLVRKKWEIGMQMIGHDAKWDQLAGSVIASKTVGFIPDVFKDLLVHGSHDYMKMDPDIELKIENRIYRIGVLPLFDVGEREIGDIVILYDVTEQVSQAEYSILIINVICFVIGMVLFVLFFIILSQVEQKMKTLQFELADNSNLMNVTQNLYFKDSKGELVSALTQPVRIIIIIGISIFIVELSIMFLFYIIPFTSTTFKMLLDSFLLVVLVSPVLYYFISRPLIDNIVELKRAEEKQKKILEHLSGLYNSSKDPIGYADSQGLILDINKSFLKMTGYSKKELLDGKRYQDITPEEYHPYETQKIEELLRTKKPQEFEKEFIRKDGSRVPVLITVFIVRESEGKPPSLAIIIKDMSERKRMEKEKEVLETKFYKTQKMETIGTMAASIAHEMNNPLAAIGFGLSNLKDLLEEDKERSEFKKEFFTYYAKITGEIGRCKRIVGVLLSFTRVTAKKEFTDVNLLGVLRNTVDLLSCEAQLKGIRLHYSFPKDPLLIKSDEGLLWQIFSNLLKNAIDAVDKEGEITICANSNGKGECSVSFKDNGSGISEENLKNIFKPFFTTKPRGEGTGLGLSICNKIAASLCGRLTCNSREGEGSTFTLTLPEKDHSRWADK